MDRSLVQDALGSDKQRQAQEEHAGVVECYRLYLTELHHLITRTLIFTYRDGRPGSFLYSQHVQYMFSVPIMWKEQAIQYFKQAIREAGFGTSPSHSYHVGAGLTEADAAAIYTMETLPGPYVGQGIQIKVRPIFYSLRFMALSSLSVEYLLKICAYRKTT